MNAHRLKIDTAPALIEKATDVLGRVMRLAPHLRPTLRLRVMGELCLCERLVEELAPLIAHDAQFAALEAMKPKRALPAFNGGRGLRALPAPRRASRKRQLVKGGAA